IGLHSSPGDVTKRFTGLRHRTKRRRPTRSEELMSVQALKCKECGERYALEARYACDVCFGPLEVEYDLSGLDAESMRRRIQAGPQTIWRYADFLPFEQPPKTALAAGVTPLVRADRLAGQLGVREVWIKNDAANPTHSFKDRVVTIAIAKARELGYEVVACASTGNLANAVAAHAAAAGLESYGFIAAQLGFELPDRVVRPIASGSLFTKIGRGFQEWIDVGLLDGEVPTMNGAQAEGCSPVAHAFESGHDICRPVRPDTIAKSLAIGD